MHDVKAKYKLRYLVFKKKVYLYKMSLFVRF